MTVSAKFSFKFSIGLPDCREDPHCEILPDDRGGWLSSSLASRFQLSPERQFLKPVYVLGSRLDAVLASRPCRNRQVQMGIKVLT